MFYSPVIIPLQNYTSTIDAPEGSAVVQLCLMSRDTSEESDIS